MAAAIVSDMGFVKGRPQGVRRPTRFRPPAFFALTMAAADPE